ncbi:MAG: hypothetical protein Q9187_000506 [Circinaria calcarea]
MPPERNNRKRELQYQSPDAPYRNRSRNPTLQGRIATRSFKQRSGTQEFPVVIAEDWLSQTHHDVPTSPTRNGPRTTLDNDDPATTPDSDDFTAGYELLRTTWQSQQDRHKAMKARIEQLEAQAKNTKDLITNLNWDIAEMEEMLEEQNVEKIMYKNKDIARERNWRELWKLYGRSVDTLRAALNCPLCFEKTADRATLCGRHFCDSCITTWLEDRSSCPTCRAALYPFSDSSYTIKLYNLSSLKDKGTSIEEGLTRLIPHEPDGSAEN